MGSSLSWNKFLGVKLLDQVLHVLMAQSLVHVQLFAALRTVARQAPLSVGFPRQEDWSGLPFPPPGDLPDPGIEPASLVAPTPAGGFPSAVPREQRPSERRHQFTALDAAHSIPALPLTICHN